jgi:hypothetical protein
MSDVKVVRYLLANSAALVAVVPAAKIQPGVIPQGTVLPGDRDLARVDRAAQDG